MSEARNYFQIAMQPASPPLTLKAGDFLRGLATSGALSALLGFIASNTGVILAGHPAEATLAAAVVGYLIDLLHRYAGANQTKQNGAQPAK